MRKILFLITLCTILSFIGCDNKTTIETPEGKLEVNSNDNEVKVETKDGEANIKLDGNSIEVKSEDGESKLSVSEDGVDLPEGYPKDMVPIIDGANVISALDTSSENKKIYAITLGINTDIKAVYDYYLEIMKDAKDLTKLEIGGGYMLSGKMDIYTVNIGVNKIDDEYKTMVTINLNQE